MSTKQTILYTLMIFFLAVMLFAMGAWFNSSMKLDQLKKAFESQHEINIVLKRTLNGVGDNPGLKEIVDDKQKGIIFQSDELEKQIPLLKDNTDPAAPGVKQLEDKYKELEPGLRKAWTEDAVKALNDSKKEREQSDADIEGALKRLATQRAEKVEKETAAAKDLAQEEGTRETELKKIAQENAKMSLDLERVRFEHESVQQKVTEVSRNLSKVKSVIPQGRIIGSERAESINGVKLTLMIKGKPVPEPKPIDPKYKVAFIDLGTRNGVRNGMTFEVYSGRHPESMAVKKGRLEVVDAGAFSSRCVVLNAVLENRWDPLTGWVPEKPEYLFSKYAADGAEESNAVPLIARTTVKDKVEAMRLEKIAKDLGLEAAQEAAAAGKGSALPPSNLSLSISPIASGDWIFNADYIPIVSTDEFHAQLREELNSMRDVNVGLLTFYIADTVRDYRKVFIKRLCEHNSCKVADVMNPNVNVVIVGAGFTDLELVKERNAGKKGKEGLKEDDKNLLATEAALEDAKKFSASVIPEDESEAFFDRRTRKQELLRGKVQQPGRSSFYIAGKMKSRSPELLAQYIQDHDGIVAPDMESKVDYVVVGESPDEAFIEKVKKLGLKILREEEVPEVLGVVTK